MRTKLEKLIATYEAERVSLTAEMEECVAEMDYGKAHLFFKGLARVNQQLQTLYNLKDKGHDEKEHLVQSIKFLEERLASEEGYMHRYLTERVTEAKEKLTELNQLSTQKVTVGHVVRDVLSKLAAGEITGFVFVILDSKRLCCYFRLVRKTLILSIPEIRRHREEYTLNKRNVRQLKKLGFKLFDDKDKLMLFASYSTLEEANTIQITLARIIFDVFYFKGLEDETFIKYNP